jgi:hypothetical protein
MNQAGILYLHEFRVPENFREGVLCEGVEGQEVFVYADLVVRGPDAEEDEDLHQFAVGIGISQLPMEQGVLRNSLGFLCTGIIVDPSSTKL